MTSNDDIFVRDDKFWSTYNIGRPSVPETFFQKIFRYHAAKGQPFDCAHDVGAGNGPYVGRLRAQFGHVIVSDIVSSNIELARQRLECLSGVTFRTAALEDTEDIEVASVDMVFASNVMHFADPQVKAMRGLAQQLKPGGTLALAAFAPAHFDDPSLQDIWRRMGVQGGRELLRSARDSESTIRLLARTEKFYNVAPLDPTLWSPGALRIDINMGIDGIQALLPPEDASRNVEPDHTGSTDVLTSEQDPEWRFEMDPAGVFAHLNSFPFVSQFHESQAPLLAELESVLKSKQSVTGHYPVKIILATRKEDDNW
nr:methyltransferase tpcm [Quercus suber]